MCVWLRLNMGLRNRLEKRYTENALFTVMTFVFGITP